MLYSVTDYIMASDLGEVRVQVEQEGAEDAAEQIGDAAGETDAEAGQGGGIGGLLGGISAKLAGILGFVTFLASLKPIQEILSGLQRLFSIAILPLVAILTTFLRPILQKLLIFFSNINFDNLIESLATNIDRVLTGIARDISNDIASSIPGVGGTTADRVVQTGGDALGQSAATALGTGSGLGSTTVNIAFDWLSEQSNTTAQQNSASSNSEQIFNFSLGS